VLEGRSSNSLLELPLVLIVPLCSRTCFCIHMTRKLFKSFYVTLAAAFNSTFQYIDDILSINNSQFHSYSDLIYPYEMEINNTTECSTSALYLDVLLKLDTNGKITTQFYNKGDAFNISIVNSHYLCSNIPASPAYGVYILQLI
jgi:hypothetical protein